MFCISESLWKDTEDLKYWWYKIWH